MPFGFVHLHSWPVLILADIALIFWDQIKQLSFYIKIIHWRHIFEQNDTYHTWNNQFRSNKMKIMSIFQLKRILYAKVWTDGQNLGQNYPRICPTIFIYLHSHLTLLLLVFVLIDPFSEILSHCSSIHHRLANKSLYFKIHSFQCFSLILSIFAWRFAIVIIAVVFLTFELTLPWQCAIQPNVSTNFGCLKIHRINRNEGKKRRTTARYRSPPPIAMSHFDGFEGKHLI